MVDTCVSGGGWDLAAILLYLRHLQEYADVHTFP